MTQTPLMCVAALIDKSRSHEQSPGQKASQHAATLSLQPCAFSLKPEHLSHQPQTISQSLIFEVSPPPPEALGLIGGQHGPIY